MIYEVSVDGQDYRLELNQSAGHWKCVVDGRDLIVDAALVRPDVISLIIDGKSYEVRSDRTVDSHLIWVDNRSHQTEFRDPRSWKGRNSSAGSDAGPRKIKAPMPGKVVRILVEESSEVESGQGVLVVEAMKMQNEIKSPKKGIVQKLNVAEGSPVNAGDVLAIIS